VLERSRQLGFLGPGEVTFHVEHALGFVDHVPPASRVMDLGSGGGLPGLVLLRECPELEELVLLDSMARRGAFLQWALAELEAPPSAKVVVERAEHAARRPELRGRFDLVVARSFGRPAVTAECAVGFLSGAGARLLVSEPPDHDEGRWPAEELQQLGLEPVRRHRTTATLQELRAVTSADPRWPRRDGVPAKRPLF
jgi:16S rRNA (guanine527-N7)-methyltransferase